jgi:hypothetical protein
MKDKEALAGFVAELQRRNIVSLTTVQCSEVLRKCRESHGSFHLPRVGQKWTGPKFMEV